MDDYFKLKASARTDEELRERIDNREKYLPETVETSVNELQFRGEVFSEEELTVITEDMQARRNMAGAPPEGFTLVKSRDANNLIEDPDAVPLYTKRAIYIFCVLFSVLFGSVMLAINVAKTPDKNNSVWVVLFGIAYTVIMVLIGLNANLGSGFTIGSSIAGAYLMDALFWNRFIGNTTLYRARPIWVPLIIGLAILIPIFILIIYSGELTKLPAK